MLSLCQVGMMINNFLLDNQLSISITLISLMNFFIIFTSIYLYPLSLVLNLVKTEPSFVENYGYKFINGWVGGQVQHQLHT